MAGEWHGHGMVSMNQTRPNCVNQMGKTHSKPLAARHGRGTAWAWHAMRESAFDVLKAVVVKDVTRSLIYQTTRRHIGDDSYIQKDIFLNETFLVSFVTVRARTARVPHLCSVVYGRLRTTLNRGLAMSLFCRTMSCYSTHSRVLLQSGKSRAILSSSRVDAKHVTSPHGSTV